MLLELSIENYALVRSLRIEFAAGLSAITGESGAGKSLLLGALGQVLGHRADIARISPEKTSSRMSALFDLSQAPVAREFLAQHGLDNADAPDECHLHRRIDMGGRSRAFVNDVSVTLATLRSLASLLVDIHAQDQHHALQNRQVQQQIFDEFAASPDELRQCASLWHAWQRGKTEVETLAANLALGRDHAELLRYQVEELEAVNLCEGEYQQISEQHERLSSVDRLREQAGQAIDLLEAEDFGISARLGQLGALLTRMQDAHRCIESAREAAHLSSSELSRATAELTRYLDHLQADPETLRQLDERLSTIVELSRKHRVAPEALFAHGLELRSQLSQLDQEDGALERLQAQVTEHKAAFEAAADALSGQRKRALPEFESRMHAYMQRLGLADANLCVNLAEHLHEHGFERATFDYAASQSLKPTALAKIASGGERSRLALAIALLAAEHSRLPSLILDEADVGIGGSLTDEVGTLLSQLACSAQVLMITHAPQVAAHANAHYRVVKSEGDAVSIVLLGESERLEEISRMLGGAHLAESTREYARELLASRQT